MINENAVSIIFYYKEDKIPKFLLLKYKVHGQKHWDFVKGRLEQGEEVIDAAKREALEETDLINFRVDNNFKEKLTYQYIKDTGETVNKKVVYLLAEVLKSQADKIKISDEHQAFKWVDYNKADKILKFKNQREILKKIKLFFKIR